MAAAATATASNLPANRKAAPAVKVKQVKGPNEDVWLKLFDSPDSLLDRNWADSFRRIALNPDMNRVTSFSCYCGNEIRLDQSWYVLVNDGTLVCNSCAQCCCCSREARPIDRRLVCIDGMVLCYRCIKHFGYPHRPKLKLRVVPIKNKLEMEDKSLVPVGTDQEANKSNSEYYLYNVPRTDRCAYVPKVDMRKRFRPRYYDQPVKRLLTEDDPVAVPPDYLGENLRQQPMLCPACNSIALGRWSYVVPSMAKVYHKRCFRCCNCKESLAYGIKFPSVHFDYCSCDVPMVWCTKMACREARFNHHRMSKCHLGCVRPGGRAQMDYTVEPAPDTGRRRKRLQQKKKQQQQQPQQHQQQPHQQLQQPHQQQQQPHQQLQQPQQQPQQQPEQQQQVRRQNSQSAESEDAITRDTGDNKTDAIPTSAVKMNAE